MGGFFKRALAYCVRNNNNLEGAAENNAARLTAIRAVVLYITAIASLAPTLANAAGDVARILPLSMWCSGSSGYTLSASCIYSTPEAACAARLANTSYTPTIRITYPWGNKTYECFGNNYWVDYLAQVGSCPANSSALTSSMSYCTCNDGYSPDLAGNCISNTCPGHAHRDTPGSPCTCDAGYSPYPYFDQMGCYPSLCPANMSGFPCACNAGYVPDPNPMGAGCVLPACPDHASRASPGAPCTCDDGYKFDAAGAKCISKCPVDPLPHPPFPASDECSNSLEKGRGKDVDGVCPRLNPKMKEPNGGQLQCLADKINKLALTPAYTGPTATIRTEAYQQHLLAVWNKQKEIDKKVLTDADKQACATVIADVTREKDEIHGLDASPSKKGSYAPHVQGIALDIPREVAKAMMAKLTNTTIVVPSPSMCFLGFCVPTPVRINDVQDYVNSPTVNPPACDLLWGGRFDDKVHFQLRHP